MTIKVKKLAKLTEEEKFQIEFEAFSSRHPEYLDNLLEAFLKWQKERKSGRSTEEKTTNVHRRSSPKPS
jgi:hypothetical protein